MNTKTIWYVVSGILLLVGGFFLLNNYIYQEKQGDGAVAEPYQATLEGEYVCLPHKNTEGPQTDECATGLRTEADEYYALDLTQVSEVVGTFSLGDSISASGLITPIERLSTDHWQQYAIEGVFSVSDSLEVSD